MKQGVKAPLDERTDHQRESHTCGSTRPRSTRTAAPTHPRARGRPGTHRHLRNKEQLQDLVLDGVLAEVNCNLNPSLAWSEQLTLLAHRRPTGRRSTGNRPQPPGPPDHLKTRKWRRTDDNQSGNPMSTV